MPKGLIGWIIFVALIMGVLLLVFKTPLGSMLGLAPTRPSGTTTRPARRTASTSKVVAE